MIMESKTAEFIVRMVLRDLNDRAGFDDWWGDVSPEIQAEIKEELAGVVKAAYAVDTAS